MNDTRMQPGHVIAAYTASNIPLYAGNPLVEALPPLYSEAEIYEKLRRDLPYSPEHRKGPASERIHMLQSLKHFFQPLPRHLSLAHNLSLMIRSGYIGKNPFPNENTPPNETLESASLMGSSGTGKSSSILNTLNLMPRVIHHHEYKGQPFPVSQVVWVKLDCPHDGSPRAVCTAFFKGLDNLLGTTYEADYGGTRSTVGHMIPALARLSKKHFVGLIVIDELQNLGSVQKGQMLLNFLVEITNDVGVPVLMVGTFAARDLFNRAFRMARRATGFLAPEWDRMQADSQEWDIFLKTLWKYQYLTEHTKLTEELRKEFYNQTQGIADLAVKLYLLVQLQGMIEETECITPEMLRAVAEVSFKRNKKYLDDLRAGRTSGDHMLDLIREPLLIPEEAESMRKAYAEKKAKNDKKPLPSSTSELRQAGLFHEPESTGK